MSVPRAARVAVAAVLLALLGLLALRAAQVALHLRAAERGLGELRAAVTAGDLPRARLAAVRVRADTAAAHAVTRGLVWQAAVHVPVAGRTPAGVARLAGTADAVMTDVALPLLDAAAQVVPAGRDGTHVDLAALAAAQPVVREAQEHLRQLGNRSSDDALVLPAVRRADRRTAERLARLTSAADALGDAVQVLPTILGSAGPRTYFVAFQTNAEARGTGGLVGAYALLEARAGSLHVLRVGSDDDLRDLPPTASAPADVDPLYGDDVQLWSNSNLSPHFPGVARRWLSKWQLQTGQHLDGAIATDPLALQSVLSALGPVRLPGGERVTAHDVVDLTERAVYARFPENEARKAFLVSVARSVSDELERVRGVDLPQLAHELVPVVRQGGLLAYSDHPDEEAVLARTRAGGAVPTQPGPYAALVVNNGGGTKLDYYLRRSLRYELEACHGDRRTSTMTIRLENALPRTPLPPYVTGPDGGTNHVLVSLFLPRGAALDRVQLDGRQIALLVRTEREHPVLLLTVALPPRRVRELQVRLVEPAVAAPPVVPVQPLVLPQQTTVAAARC